jgi:hypothetical protein
MNGHEFSAEHAAAIEALKNQLLIVLVKRLGGKIDIPVAEIDDTSQDLLLMQLNPDKRRFEFSISKKS